MKVGVLDYNSSLAASALDLSIQVVSELAPQQLVDRIHFSNAAGPGQRLDAFAAAFAIHFANEFILNEGSWGNESASVKRRMSKSECGATMVFRDGRQVPLYAPLLPMTTPDAFFAPVVVFRDEAFLAHLAPACGEFAFLGTSRCCPSSIFISALLMFRCGALLQNHGHREETMRANPHRTVLGVGPYRAQTTMLVECLQFIGGLLLAGTRKLTSTWVSFLAATGAAVQGSSVLDIVVIMLANAGGLTKCGADPRWFVNMFSRHMRSMGVLVPQGRTCGSGRDAELISPRLVLQATKRMLSGRGAVRLDICVLVRCLFPHGSEEAIDAWIREAVEAWRDVRKVYRERLFADSQGREKHSDDAFACYNWALDPTLVSDESANAVCPAAQVMWNYMQVLMERLCPTMAKEILAIEVVHRRSTKAVRRFTERGHRNFASAISGELPVAREYGGTLLYLVIYTHRWCKAHYVYSCVLGLDGGAHGREGALASIEM